MTSARRYTAGIAVGVAAVIIAAVGISSGHTAPRTDPFRLDARAPRSIIVAFNVSTNSSLRTSGTLWIDAATDSLRATLQVPIVTADTEIDLRAIGHRLYLTSPNLADATGPVWYVQSLTLPSLTGLARLLQRPSVGLLTLLANASIARSGSFTHYQVHRTNVSLGTLSSPGTSTPHSGNLELTITTGREGEFTDLTARLDSGSHTTSLRLHVLAYNAPLRITPPPASRASTPAGPLLRQLLTSGALGSLVVPTQLLHLLATAKLS